MFKRCKLVMLPTNEKAPLMIDKEGLHYAKNYEFNLFDHNKNFRHINKQHIYILSDEEIKEGDFFIYPDLGEKDIWLCKGDIPNPGAKKIIATTDTALKWHMIGFLPQPSQSFIEKYVEEYNKSNIITEVMVEYKPIGAYANPKYESDYQLKVNPKDNTITITKVKDSWNKYEHIANLIKYRNDYEIFKQNCHFGPNQREIEEWSNNWIEENL